MSEPIEDGVVEKVELFIASNANKNCQKCFGRGHDGIDPKGKKIICSCVIKNLSKKKKT